MPPRVAAAGRADGRVRRALLLRAGAPPGPGEGRLPRYTWRDALRRAPREARRARRALGGAYRVLVDANQHVDREGAVRAGVGFYGKNTMLITRRHGSWVVLGTLVTDVEIEPTPPLELDCGDCRLCIDACPTGALDEPGTLDATRCLSYWTQAPGRSRRRTGSRSATWSTAATSARTSAPGTAASRSAARTSAAARREPHVSLADWLEADGDVLRDALRPALRPAQRPALPAPERARRARQRRRRRRRGAGRAVRRGRRRAAARARRVGARPDARSAQ